MSIQPANDPTRCRRTSARSPILHPSTLRIADARPLDVIVDDLSANGLCFSGDVDVPVGTAIWVGLAGAGRASAQIAWQREARFGCTFTPSLSQGQIDAAFSHSRDSVTVALAPGIIPPPMHTARAIGIAPAARFFLLALGGASAWAVFAMGLHGLRLH